ncbi:MAG: TlyA family RNA methyltransferase [Clostridia bacterium]|nr:TlyA family RNA methyltransferase [Clostridia bacterium]
MAEMTRADAALHARGLAASREKARALIEAGLATVNGEMITKPARKVGPQDVLAVLGQAHPYVGRGGLKLEKALKSFDADPSGLACMDIGASTGGFTDVLLQNGARKVYAIDVGFGQLDPLLAADPRVVSMERVNARSLTPDMFPEPPTLGVMDVSFISITLILPAAFGVLGGAGRLISLVKPQFEAGRAQVGKHGVVSKPSAHIDVLRRVVDFAPTLGWRAQGLDYSPIAGGSGNLEFLADFVPEGRCSHFITPEEIAALVRRAHGAVPLK